MKIFSNVMIRNNLTVVKIFAGPHLLARARVYPGGDPGVGLGHVVLPPHDVQRREQHRQQLQDKQRPALA